MEKAEFELFFLPLQIIFLILAKSKRLDRAFLKIAMIDYEGTTWCHPRYQLHLKNVHGCSL